MDGSPNLNSHLLAGTDHFDGRRFFNPHAPRPRTASEVRRWRRERRKEPWPERVEVPGFPPPADVAQVFGSCPDRVMPSASRSLLSAGPDRLRDAAGELAAEFRAALPA